MTKNTRTQEINKGSLTVKAVFYFITLVYGLLCLYLFYRQSLMPVYGDSLYFESDLPYHISMVVDDGWYYSLTAFIYLGLYKLAGGGTILIAIFLAVVMTATVIATERLLREVFGEKKIITCPGALALNLVMPFFVRWAGMYRYVSYQSGNVWHNSTYICMRLAAVIFMIFYLRYEKLYAGESYKIKHWLILAAVLAVTTFIKPSFLTVFAPALAIKLLWDLIKNKVRLLKVLVKGLIVVPSLGVMLWQNSVLFGDDTENGFRISFMETFSFHADHPKVTVLLSLAFPLAVGIFILADVLIKLIKDRDKKAIFKLDGVYVFSILMGIVGFAEAILLIETGSRSRDGNFLWGYSIALFFLYLTSFVRWTGFLEEKKWVRSAVCGGVFVYQMICGVIFFSRLVAGETYFML